MLSKSTIPFGKKWLKNSAGRLLQLSKPVRADDLQRRGQQTKCCPGHIKQERHRRDGHHHHLGLKADHGLIQQHRHQHIQGLGHRHSGLTVKAEVIAQGIGQLQSEQIQNQKVQLERYTPYMIFMNLVSLHFSHVNHKSTTKLQKKKYG